VITPVNPVTVLLVNTNNFVQNILFSTYYLAQGSNPYVMPYGSIMTSFVVRVDGTNINMTFQSDSNPNLFTWNDNQARVGTVDTVVNLDTGINISGCNKFIFNNLVYASAAQPVNLIANLGIIIYGYMIS